MNFIDRGFGFFDGNGPAIRHDPAFTSRWLEESLSTGGNDYYHPQTRIHFIEGAQDLRMRAIGADYFNRLSSEGTPFLAWEIVPETAHQVHATEPGRTAIKNALLGGPVIGP